MCRRGSRERLRRGCEVRVRVRRSGMSRKERMWRRSSEGRVGRFGGVVVDMVASIGLLILMDARLDIASCRGAYFGSIRGVLDSHGLRWERMQCRGFADVGNAFRVVMWWK